MKKFTTVAVPTEEKAEYINSRIPNGTLARMDNVLNGGELRAGFVRVAIETELLRRERQLMRVS